MSEQLENEIATEETNNELDFESLVGEKSSTYTKLSDKYEDTMSSASTLLFVGIAGIIFIALIYFKVISLPMDVSTSWLFDLVMGGVFIGFTIAGVVSFIHAKQLKVDAAAENQTIETILDWSKQNITKDVLDQGIDCSQPEEILYFSRYDTIKDLLMHQFEDADESLIEDLSETVYQNIYEADEESSEQ